MMLEKLRNSLTAASASLKKAKQRAEELAIATFYLVKRLYTRINRYTLAFLIFAIAMTTVDESNIFERNRQYIQIYQLRNEIDRYKQELEESRHRLHSLRTNKEQLEKFAREEFLMKNEKEDIFIIED